MRRTLLIAITLFVYSVSPARADDPKKDAPPVASKSDEASQHFRSGVAFYKDHDFAAALVEFKRAYELVPNYGVLYNLGQNPMGRLGVIRARLAGLCIELPLGERGKSARR